MPIFNTSNIFTKNRLIFATKLKQTPYTTKTQYLIIILFYKLISLNYPDGDLPSYNYLQIFIL